MSKVVALLSAAHAKRGQGDLAAAEQILRRALGESPGHAGASKALGALLLDAGRAGEAAAVLGEATRGRAGDTETLIMLGKALFLTDRFPEASQVLETAVVMNRESYAGRLWLAKCRIAMGRSAEAEAMLRPLVAARPDDPMAVSALGKACIGLGKRREAIEHYRGAVRLGATAVAHSDLGYALYVSEEGDEALTQFDAALAIDPRLVSAVGGKAMILADRNAREEARALLSGAIEAGLLDTVLATTFARVSKGPEQRAEAARVLERSLARPSLSPGEVSSIRLALATLKEADGDYDGAFACYKAGNDAIGLRFDGAAWERFGDEIIEAFSAERIARLPRSSNVDDLPVFILGMPRSGTSLIEQILDSLPGVHGAGELNDVGVLAHHAAGILGAPGLPPFPRSITFLGQGQIEALSRRYLDRLRALGGAAARVTDKMPQNFLYLGLIDHLFPGAKVIHTLRHPLDTCLSCYTTGLNYSQAYKTRQGDLVVYYRVYRKLMEHFRKTVRVPILEVRYEEMVADTENQARRIVDFIGMEWDPRCLKFYESTRVARTSSNDQVRRPVYNSSVGRWKHFEPHLKEMIEGMAGFTAAYEADA